MDQENWKIRLAKGMFTKLKHPFSPFTSVVLMIPVIYISYSPMTTWTIWGYRVLEKISFIVIAIVSGGFYLHVEFSDLEGLMARFYQTLYSIGLVFLFILFVVPLFGLVSYRLMGSLSPVLLILYEIIITIGLVSLLLLREDLNIGRFKEIVSKYLFSGS